MPERKRRPSPPTTSPRGWDPLADWYDGWVGKGGSLHHRKLAVPAVMELLEVQPGERILDLGCGQGVLAPFVAEKGARYTGVDVSRKLIRMAGQHHPKHGEFLIGDVRGLRKIDPLRQASFDAAVFLLSIQDIDPLDAAFENAAWAIRSGGRLILMMTHPGFRIPRQSGWGWDENRKLQYRRTDRYLTELAVPLKPFPGESGGVSLSFHRPLHAYVNALGAVGLRIDRMLEIPTYKRVTSGPKAKAENLANAEIPLFLALRAWKGGADR